MECVRIGFIKGEKELDLIKIKAPHSYMIFWNLLIFGLILAFVGFMFLEYQKTRAVPFEIEGSCNTGFIGIDYKSTFDNQPYSYLQQVYEGPDPQSFKLVKHTRYFKEYIPKEINLKNIDGLNCNFKVKGVIPLNILQVIR